jgi:hypothetical protein
MARPALKKSRPRITLGLLCCLRLLFLGIDDRGSRSDEGCVKRLTPLTRRAPPGPKRATFTLLSPETKSKTGLRRFSPASTPLESCGSTFQGCYWGPSGGVLVALAGPRVVLVQAKQTLPNEPSLLGSRPRSSNRRRQARVCTGLTPL